MSQLKNKKEAVQKFILIINNALMPIRLRKATKPTLASRKKRIDSKKHRSLKKHLRRRPEF